MTAFSRPVRGLISDHHCVSLLLGATLIHASCAKSADHPSTATSSASLTQIVDETKACKDANSTSGLCAPTKLHWQPSDFTYPSNSPTVLHLEPGVTDLLALGKYRNRVKAILHQQADGTFVRVGEHRTQDSVTAGFTQFFDRLHLGSDSEASTYALRSVAPAFSRTFAAEAGAIGQGLTGGHALITLGIIGEYAPNAALVVAKMQDHMPEDILCTKDLGSLEAYVTRASNSLLSLTASLGVNVMNLSGGDSYASIEKQVRALCPAQFQSFSSDDIKQVLATLEPFYRHISTDGGAVIVQSGGSFGAGDSDPERNPIDCPAHAYPNRLRIGYLDLERSSIGASGESIHDYQSDVPSSLKQGSSCVDLYVNSQSHQGVASERPVEVTIDGVFTQPLPIMYTSFAAPIVTARLVNLMQTSGSTNPQALINQLTDHGQRQVQDPLKHRQFEVWRLKYRTD